MKFEVHVPCAAICLVLVACAMGVMAPAASWAQAEPAALAAAPEFDWSDYRGTAKGRLFLARLSSVNISGPNFQQETVGPYLTNDMHLFKEILATLYVGRLGLRVCAEEATVGGRHEALVTGLVPADVARYPELDIGPTRIGMDLDIVRYPFVKVGLNLDYGFHGVRFKHVRVPPNIANADQIEQAEYRSDGPITIGIHGQAIPFRIKEVPAIVQARVRVPPPYLQQFANAVGLKQIAEIAKVKAVDWEISAGLRPAVWDTSFYGYSTFSASIEAGFRSFTIDTPLTALPMAPPYQPNFPPNLDLRAHWQGVFFQAAVFY